MVAGAAFSTPEQLQHQTFLVRGTVNGSLAKDLILGPFIVAYAVQVLGYSNGEISWFLSLIPLLILARYPFLDVIRNVPRITVIGWSRYVQLSCLVALFVLPPDLVSLPVLVLIGVCFVFGNEFLQNAVWMNLVAEVSHHRDRGRFLGKLRMWKQATNMSFALFGFVLVGDSLSKGEFNILLVGVALLLVNSLFWYAKLPARAPAADQGAFQGRGQSLNILRTHPLMRRPLVMTFLLAVQQWPILIVFVVGTLHLPANLLMLTVVATMTGSIVSEVFWGKRVDQVGIGNVFKWCFAGTLALYPLLLFVPDYAQIVTGSAQYVWGTVLLLIFYFCNGVLAAGQMMAISIYRAAYLDQPGGFHALNLLMAINQLFLAALTALGGFLLVQLAVPDAMQWGAIWVDPFRLATLTIVLTAVVAGLWVASGIIHDPKLMAARG